MAARKKTKGSPKKPWLIAAFLTILLIISLAATFYFIFLRSGSSIPKPPHIIAHTQLQSSHVAATRLITPASKKQPFVARVAIVIDDIGNQNKLAAGIMDLDLNLSFSFLPYRPFTKILEQKAVGLGRDVLLHLPMEPLDHKWNPGKGALLLSMSKANILATLAGDLAQVPMAVGVNNHMGSGFTENRRGMRIFLSGLRHKNLFWLDSLTTARSVGFEMAREIGLTTAKRDVFLDNIQKSAKIIIQLNKLLHVARRQGYAIGIAHPHPETLKALKRYQYTLRQEVKLVGIHEIMQRL